jgi:hypothetical protein
MLPYYLTRNVEKTKQYPNTFFKGAVLKQAENETVKQATREDGKKLSETVICDPSQGCEYDA